MGLGTSGRILGAEKFVERKNCEAVVINEDQTIISRERMSRVTRVVARKSEWKKCKLVSSASDDKI